MFKYILLGIIQGLTEFLPVSSSGHLVIAQKILGISRGLVELEIVLHLGTLLAVFIFFFRDLLKALSDKKLFLLIIVVTLITGAIGVSGNDFFEGLFSSTKAVAFSWVFTGIILLLTKNFLGGKRDSLNFKDAVILGFTQGAGIIPGVSRSGITISTLLFRRVDKITSFTFSFLVSMPVILGAAVVKAHKIGFILKGQTLNLLTGFFFSFLFGIISIWLLKKILDKAKFYYFGYYCIAIAIIVFLFVK
jgi:undecaprenyl-diphosphatase